jgi:hypothetical protein
MSRGFFTSECVSRSFKASSNAAFSSRRGTSVASCRVTLVMFEEDGSEVLRITVGHLYGGNNKDMHGLLLKVERTGIVSAPLALYPWTV